MSVYTAAERVQLTAVCIQAESLFVADSPNKAAPTASFAQNSAEVHASAIVIVVIDTTSEWHRDH